MRIDPFSGFANGSRLPSNSIHIVQGNEAVVRLILLFSAVFLASLSSAAVRPNLVRLIPPSGFEGPTLSDDSGGGHIEAYVRPIPGTSRSTLLQVSMYDFGSKLEGVPESELGNGAEHYLLQFLAGVERARSNFQATKPTRTRIGNFPSARVEWSGIARGRPMSGVMYCVIVGTTVVSFHMQGFEDSPPEDRNAALRAIESVSFSSGK